jgi:arylsulfatase A-like enzyme
MTRQSSPRMAGDTAEPWSPPVTLFAISGAMGVFTALAGSIVLGIAAGTARPREITLFWLLRFVCDAAGLSLLRVAPAIVNVPFDLATFRGATQFAATAVAMNLLISWLAALTLLPVVTAVRRRRSGEHSPGWTRDFPAATFALFALPSLVGLMDAWLRTPRIALTVAASLAAGVILWLVLRLACGSIRRARLLLGGASSLAAAMALLVALAAAAAGRASSQAAAVGRPPPAGAPNVLLVSIDSLRRDHLHCYGYRRETSPTIDRLAREGALFRTVVSPTSWTLPAHLTLLTSLPPEVHGVVVDAMRLATHSPALAEVLREAGWATAGFVSGAYLDAIYGFSRGFDLYDDYSLVRSSPRFSRRSVTSPALAEQVGAWLRRWQEAGRERPFFLFVHMFDVHYDYEPPPPYDRLFDPDYSGPLREDQFRHSSGIPDHMSPRDLQHLIALYDGEIIFTDHHLGRIFEQLRELGVFDDTIVAVTSDHGDEFFEHGHVGHRQSLYDELVLVPLVVRYPRRVPAGRVIEGQARLMDVGPTLLSLAGVPAADFGVIGAGRPDGAQDLTPAFAAGARPPELVAFGDLEGKLASIRAGGLKYLQGKPGPGEELYDLRVDPGEQRNRLAEQRPVATALGEQLAHWRAQSGALGVGRAEAVAIDAEHRERLRSLGYVQ